MALEAKRPSGSSLKTEDWWKNLSALEYAGVVLTGLKTVAGVAPFGSQLQACIDLAQAIVNNVKVMQSFRASEDNLTKRVAETLRIIVDALQRRNCYDTHELERDLRPLEIVMEDIMIFTSKQKSKSSLQRFMDAGDDMKQAQQFNSDLNDNLLQLHTKVMFDVDKTVKSMQWMSKKRHEEVMNKLSRVEAIMNKGKSLERLEDSKNAQRNADETENWRGREGYPEHDLERGRSWKGKAPERPLNLPKKEIKKDWKEKIPWRKDGQRSKPPEKIRKASEKREHIPRPNSNGKDSSDPKWLNGRWENQRDPTNEPGKSRDGRIENRKSGRPPPRPMGLPPELNKRRKLREDRDDSDRESVISAAASDVAVVGRRGDRKDDARNPPRDHSKAPPRIQDDSDAESTVSWPDSNVAVANWKSDKSRKKGTTTSHRPDKWRGSRSRGWKRERRNEARCPKKKNS